MSNPATREFYDASYHFAEDASRPDEMRIWRAMRHLLPMNGSVYFDLGCGAGWAVRMSLARGGAARAIGLDFSSTGLRLARQHTPMASWIQGDGTAIPLSDSSIDRLFCNGALEHFPDVKRGIGEIARVLRPGGRAVIIVPNFYVKTEQPMEFRASYGNWKKLLQAGGLHIERTGIDFGPPIFKNANLKRILARAAGKILSLVPFMQYQFVFVTTRKSRISDPKPEI